MIYHNRISAEGDLTNEDEQRLIDWHWLSWTGGSTFFEQLVIKSPYLSYRHQRSRYIKSDS